MPRRPVETVEIDGKFSISAVVWLAPWLLAIPVVETLAEHVLAPQRPPGMRVRVDGPEATSLSPTEMRRLFRGRRLTPSRRVRLANSGRVVAACGSRIVGVAAYERADGELHVHEFGVDASTACTVDDIATALLDALELACLAGGGRRLVVLPRAAIVAHLLRSRGFVTIAQDSAGGWFQKVFPS